MSHVSCLQVAMIVYGTTVGFASYLLAAKSEETQNSVLCAWHCWDGRELWSLQTGLKLLQPLYFIDSWQRMPTDFPVPFGPFCVGSIAESGCVQLFIAHVYMCTFKRSDGSSIVFTTFSVLFEHQFLM